MQTAKHPIVPFTPYQKFAIFILAITQFTVILDFMVMSPLGDILMKSMTIKPSAFGFAVSAYAFSAGISGLLTAGFADKFDRKKLLLFFYIGFIAGTILEGLFIVGFFTRKYDKYLLIFSIFLPLGFWFTADAYFFEFLILSLTLVNFHALYAPRRFANSLKRGALTPV